MKPQHNLKNRKGKRGKQKIPPSGHLAPTIQRKNGILYPRLDDIPEHKRLFVLYHCPETKPDWFIWLYQWAQQNPYTGGWYTRSKRVPLSKLTQIKNAIARKETIASILTLIQH